MIKLLAIVTFLLAGAPQEPAKTFTFTQLFDDVATCEEVRTGDRGKIALEQLQEFVKANLESEAGELAVKADDFRIETKCAPVE